MAARFSRMQVEPDAPPAVVVDGVSKRFRVPNEHVHTLKERALHPLRRSGNQQFTALEDVSFAVQPGEFFGIVGRNGSGKSTLLKCLAGIYGVDRGTIHVAGRLSPFIELGVGFNPDLAARDNVVLNATMLGLSRAEARERFEDVIRFAELEEFEELKLKNYSSGMHVRLAFSVMIQVDADVLLIDEVLAVGDASFQQKCFEVFQRMRDEGKTILFVTHDMSAVKRFCHRGILLEHGRIAASGDPERVGSRYMDLNFARQEAIDAVDEDERYGDRTADIVDAWFEDEHGERAQHLQSGQACSFKIRVRFDVDENEPVIAFLLEDERHNPVFAIAHHEGGIATGAHRAGDEGVFSATFENQFGSGRLYATPWVMHEWSEGVMDRRPRMTSVMITSLRNSGALLDLPTDLSYERSASAQPSPVPPGG